MRLFNKESLILKKEAFLRTEIEKRMADGGFNSLSRFELFIWDLEMYLQLQKRLGDKIILKGGAATQFYIPISAQRTSIDIEMICLASREDVHQAISDIEDDFAGAGEYFSFRFYEPKNPKIYLDALETYFATVPSICNEQELFSAKGKLEVKIECFFSKGEYAISRIKPELFALKTEKEFNVLSFEDLFADKLTTLGPNIIGISDERADEQLKQIYDVLTLFVSNIDRVINNKELIRIDYEKAAHVECMIHGVPYVNTQLLDDMKLLINRLKNIESDSQLLQRANDFQALYLRKSVNRDKAQWAIAGYQLDLLVNYIFHDDMRIHLFREIDKFIENLRFEHIRGPEHGKINKEVRDLLAKNFGNITGLSTDLFKKRIDRIIWELVARTDYRMIKEVLSDLVEPD